MIPAPFDYHRPQSLAEAIALLEAHGGEAKVLSGGQSLLPLLKMRLGAAGQLVDIGRLSGLDSIREEGGYLSIGALVREAALERSALIASRYPLLADAAAVIADPVVRNQATVGGNLAHADPANDHPAVMLALRAQILASGPGGQRTIAIDDFFVDLFTTALGPAEILTEIRIPMPPPRSGGAYKKLERKVGDFATAATAVQLSLGAGGEVVSVGIGLTDAGPVPLRAADAELFLTGKVPSDEVIAEAARRAAAAGSPSADRRGAVEYKREMSRVLTARAIRRALARAQEG